MKKYFIEEEEVSEKEFYERLEDETRLYVEDNYDDILDDTYPEVRLGYLTFLPSRIIKELDPIAYNCGIDDEVNYFLEDFKNEVEKYGHTSINKYDFDIEEYEDEE